MSIWHWLVLLITIGIYVVPIGHLLARLGLNRWLSLLTLVPVVNIAALWFLAYSKWPIADGRKQ